MMRAILLHLNTQQKCSRPEITEFEVFGQLRDSLGHGSITFRDKSNVINEDRNNDLDVTFGVDVDGAVGAKPRVANAFKNTPEFLIPLSGSLLEAIE